MNPIISLIAPAYNVEKYIEACVHSCENQDLPRDSYEIIIVNDGSTDSTYSTIERLSGVYENIRIVTQKNQGLSVARNNGFKLALVNMYGLLILMIAFLPIVSENV